MDLLLNIAKKLNELILKEEDKIPYSMNLIDELHSLWSLLKAKVFQL